mmetsp:Transcript_81410/g.217729  ORF Transcript_81410/g.217729 Transcript_81410/m.217729 type:complete len:265 (+) Transcript_81410:2422-3216(+)
MDTKCNVPVTEELVVLKILQRLWNVSVQVIGQSYPKYAVDDIAFKLSSRDRHGVKVLVLIGQASAYLKFEPKTKDLRSSYNIANKRVVRIGDPEGTGRHVRFHAVGAHVGNDDIRLDSQDTNVSYKLVARLDAVFQHVAVTFGGIGNILLDEKVIGTVHNNAALVGITDSIFGYHRARHVPAHVKMDRVSSQEPFLSKVDDLHSFNALVHTGSVHDPKVTTIRTGGALKDDVARKQGNLGCRVWAIEKRYRAVDGFVEVETNPT